jgi:hypothetical protein
MSDERERAGQTVGGETPSKAQTEFERYKARLTTMQPMQEAVMMPWGAYAGGMPGWAFPPSLAVAPSMMPSPYPGPMPGGYLGSSWLFGRLGETLRLGIEVVNAALGSGLSALSGFYGTMPSWGYEPHQYGAGYGCGCGGCSCSCCDVTECCSCCCAPGVHGCR